jgi:tryptophan-rich sensory protein
MTAQPHPSPRPSPWPSLLGFLVLCYAVAAIGGWATSASLQDWYPGLRKPVFNPPNWVFGPVWTALYAMIAVSGFRIWRRRRAAGAGLALGAWGLQLGLNLAWSLIFFGARRIGLAAAEVLLLDVAIAAALVLALRVDRVAGLLLAPYLAWSGFASALTLALAHLN